MDLSAMVANGLEGRSCTTEEALGVLAWPDEDLIELVAAASKLRRRFFGNKVKLNYLVNLKSGMCPEDCHYCSQSIGSKAEILRYTWLSPADVDASVRAGVEHGASTVCLVASGRGPSEREVAKVAEIVAKIHADHPDLKICTCLGFIDEKKAATLVDAGSSRYNHNLNTAESRYEDICSTHSYADRASTVEAVAAAGMSPCSGLIAGMGETDEQLVEVAFALGRLGVDSIPINLLLPFEGTKLEAHQELTPQRALKIFAMMRFVNPTIEIRSAAGREYHLRSLQPLALEIVNSIFLGDYLTSEGQAGAADLQMLRDGGWEIVGQDPANLGEVCAGDNQEMAKVIDAAGVAIRHRGVGTQVPANA